MKEPENCTVEGKLSWKKWIYNIVLPYSHCLSPRGIDDPADMLVLKTITKFALLDRIRVVFTGELTIVTKTAMEFPIGKSITNVASYVSYGETLD